MKLCRNAMIGGLLIVAGSVACAAAGQSAGEAVAIRTVSVSGARPVRLALRELADRYEIAVTYEEPRYVHAQDLEDISYVHKGPIPSGVNLIAPRGGRIYFQYAEVKGKPQEDMTSLIHRLLAEYAAQGGPLFDVRERTTPKGTEWNVVPLKARGSSGDMVDQPDILGAPIFIPTAQRSEGEFLLEMLQQLRTETGYKVVLGTVETRLGWGTADLGAENIPARDVLANLFGTGMVWDLNYDPEGAGQYVLNLTWTPRPPITLDAYTLPPGAARTPSRRPDYTPPGAALRRIMSPQGRIELQSKLAQAGYYSGEPDGKWDEKTVDALKKFQAANSITVTGKLDPVTIQKLGLDTVIAGPH